ncbi:MAG: IS66 family insertion sequence element accessory protein TnpA [Steroidobacteraceae bacterium]
MRLSPSRRRKDVRAWWAEHLAAQRKSGQTQVAYCRARGLDAKYFTLWKGKLRAAAFTDVPRMVPVRVAPTPEPPVPAIPETVPASAVACLRLSLANGMSVSLEIALGALPAVVRALATLRC